MAIAAKSLVWDAKGNRIDPALRIPAGSLRWLHQLFFYLGSLAMIPGFLAHSDRFKIFACVFAVVAYSVDSCFLWASRAGRIHLPIDDREAATQRITSAMESAGLTSLRIARRALIWA